MNGIDNILSRISDEARQKAELARREASEKAEQIEAEGRRAAEREYARLVQNGEEDAARLEARLRSASDLALRNRTLAAKQELIDAAFSRAVEKLCALKGAEKVSVLSRLAANAASGGGELIFNEADRTECGAEVTAAANKLRGGSEPPLTLSAATRPILGGVIVSDGRIETNCSFEALVYSGKNSLAGEVAKLLFE